MQVDTPTSQPGTDQRPRSNRPRGPRRGRGGANNGAALSFRPASVAPVDQSASATASSADNSANEAPARNATSRRGRGRGARPASHVPDRTVNGRRFGGQLTQHDTSDSTSAVNRLQANAAEFVPGQQHPPRSQPKQTPRQTLPPKRRASKSLAPDIATRTHEDIDNGHYECPICTSDVQRNSKVWSCHTCWTVFHLTCVKKWSANEGSAAAQQNLENGDLPPRQWRCPGCNLPKDVLPKSYTCWCEKETDPRPLAGLPPHSCGQSCGRERARKCPHPCPLTCHAGPCPPCSHVGPKQICFCGRHEVSKRCSETDYDRGWSCGEVCGELMPCGQHSCPRPCHEGLCGGCEELVPARCYCGQSEKDLLCGDRGDEKESQLARSSADGGSEVETWTGSFVCDNECNRSFDCGIHQCEKRCHVQDATTQHCPRSPDIVDHCPCGKTSLDQISDVVRQTCEDPIPSCDRPCDKTLACGHMCKQICHTGNCAPCMETVSIKCRCGRVESATVCHQGTEEQPQCRRICRVNLNCGRHACDEHCCPGERKALDRQTTKRKQRPLNSAPRAIDDGFEAEHICTRQCGRLLKCGIHICQDLCHKGPCETCREAIFEEIACPCGRTVLQPPLPCGTSSPPCRYNCTRPKHCGHPRVPHTCHPDEEPCTKCPFLMEKRCMCGKKTLKNQQCWLSDVRCGEICGKTLRCGSHFCRKPCHRAGECEDADARTCQQACAKAKAACGHPDENVCHAPFPCKEDKPCQSKIFVTCECQAQKQEMKCGASKSGEGNNGKSLPCNDECARLERNRRLAVALHIDQSVHVEGGDHIPYSTETLNLFAEHIKWSQTQEREFRVFATSDEERRLRFKPMKARERNFIHSLANDFGLDSESMDPEPHRHVMVWKTPRFVSAPNKTLAESLRIRQAQRAAAGSAYNSETESARKSKANETAEPCNGFVISHPRFGLTVEELRHEVSSVLPPDSPLTFDISFLPSEEVVLKAVARETLSPTDLEATLKDLKSALATATAAKSYGILQLCATDSSLNITYRESDAVENGWSRVAAKSTGPKFLASRPSYAGSNTFAALSGVGNGKVTFAKKVPVVAKAKSKEKMRKEEVVEDWEAAVTAEEEREKEKDGRTEALSAEEQPAIEGNVSAVAVDVAAPSQNEGLSPVVETADVVDVKEDKDKETGGASPAA